MLETTMHALRHPAYSERYQRNKKRLGRERGARGSVFRTLDVTALVG
jgi:hypothetical protein